MIRKITMEWGRGERIDEICGKYKDPGVIEHREIDI